MMIARAGATGDARRLAAARRPVQRNREAQFRQPFQRLEHSPGPPGAGHGGFHAGRRGSGTVALPGQAGGPPVALTGQLVVPDSLLVRLTGLAQLSLKLTQATI